MTQQKLITTILDPHTTNIGSVGIAMVEAAKKTEK